MNETSRTMPAGETLDWSANVPSTPEVVPCVVPEIMIVAPMTGTPFLSTILPVIWLACCGCAPPRAERMMLLLSIE